MKSLLSIIPKGSFRKSCQKEHRLKTIGLTSATNAEVLSRTLNIPVTSGFVQTGRGLLPALILSDAIPCATLQYLIRNYSCRVGIAWANNIGGETVFKLISMHGSAEEAYQEMNTKSFLVRIMGADGDDVGWVESLRRFCLFSQEDGEIEDDIRP